MYRLQGRKCVAAHVNKVFHARLSPALRVITRSAGEMHDRASRSERLGSARRLTLVHLVGRTQARNFCARRLEGGNYVGPVLEAAIRNGLDAAGFVKILSESRPCREVGQFAEICEKNFWPRASFGEDAVRGFA